MSVSLEGVYRLIDRASPTLEKIERRAQAADRAIDKLGRSMDKLGARQAVSKVEGLTGNLGKLEAQTSKVERTMARTSTTSTSLSRNLDKTSGSTRRATSDMGRFESLMRKVVVISTGFMKVLAPAKITVILAAIRPLIGVVSALVAGAAGLVQQLVSAAGAAVPIIARMGDLAGAGAAAATVLLSVKAATMVTKFAFDGMKQAISGSASAMKKLTPEARAFAKEMRSLQPVLNTIRSSAQKGLFPGLTGALQTARKNGAFRTANAAVGGIGQAVGGVAQNAASTLASPSALRDSLQQAQTFAFVITHLGAGAVSLADAFRNVLFAAQPLTRWLSTTVQGWAAYLDKQVQVGRASGALSAYFDRTRTSLTRIGHAARDFGVAFLNILRVARGQSKPLGQDLAQIAAQFRSWTESFQNQASVAMWFERAQKSAHTLGGTLVNLTRLLVGIGGASRELGTGMNQGIEETTRRWATWVNSFSGQNEINRWMNGMRSTLHELWGLVSDLSGAFARLGQGGGGATSILQQLRSLVPDLEGVLRNINANLGPGLFSTLTQIVHLLSTLTMAGSSPLGLFLRATAGILSSVNSILDRFKAVRVAAATAITVITGALLLRKLAQIAGGVGSIAAAWGRVTGQTVGATRAAATYGEVSGGAGGMFARMNPRVAKAGETAEEVAVAGGRRGLGRFGGLATGLGIGLPIAAGIGTQMLQSSGVIGGHTAGILGGASSGAGMGALAGSFIGPEGTVAGAVLGGVIGAGLGDSSPSVNSQNLQRLQSSAGRQGFDISAAGGGAQNLAQANRYQRILDQNLTQLQGGRRKAPNVGGIRGQFDAAIAAVQKLRGENIQLLGQERARAKTLREQTAEIQKQARARSSRSIAGNLLNEYGEAYNVYRKGGKTVAQATRLTREHMESRAKTLNPAGARVLFEGGTKWLSEMQKQHPEVKKEYDKWTADMKTTMNRMGVEVTTSGDKVLSTTTQQWQKIKTAMQSPLEQALQEMSPKFTQLQNQARAVLIGLGYTPGQAANVIRTMEAGGAGPSAAAAGLGGKAASGASGHAHGAATGGRIGGFGLQDTVPIAPGTMAAPGELIVNRHTESKADRLLRMAGGPTLGSLVGGETRRHDQDILPDAGIFMAKGGRLQKVIQEANRIDSMHIPYAWGGSHGTPSNPNGPWDCSSATSRVLQAAGYGNPTMVSGQFENWGLPGPGPIGIAANQGHVYMVINGRAWGTSRSNPGGGPGWINGYTWRPGFVQRHAPGAGSAGGASIFDTTTTGPGGKPLMGALNYSAFGAGLGGMPLAASVRGGHAVAVGLQGKVNQTLASMSETGPLRDRKAMGGRVEWGGWHAGGLNRTFDRPTMIGVGERGSEHVSVTPTSGTGGRGGGPLIHIEHLEVHAGGAPGSVQREVEAALEAVARDLEHAPAVGGS